MAKLTPTKAPKLKMHPPLDAVQCYRKVMVACGLREAAYKGMEADNLTMARRRGGQTAHDGGGKAKRKPRPEKRD